MKKLLAALMLWLLAATPLSAQDLADVSLPDPRQEEQALELMDSIRCVVCQGQPISGSNAGLAADMRRVIRERIGAGETPEEVRAWLIQRYGDWVSFKPQVRGETMPLWLLPLGALLGGLWLVSRRLRLRRRTA